MSSAQTKELIIGAIERFEEEVPSLRQLKLVAKLELAAHGADAPIWRVEIPGPAVVRDAAADARIEITISRSHFNELAADGRLRQWVEAYEQGHVKVSGDAAVTRLLGTVIQRQLGRSRQ